MIVMLVKFVVMKINIKNFISDFKLEIKLNNYYKMKQYYE